MDNPRIATAILGSARVQRRVRERDTPGFLERLARRLGLASPAAPRRT